MTGAFKSRLWLLNLQISWRFYQSAIAVCVLLAFLPACCFVDASWSTWVPQSQNDAEGEGLQPSIRYGHSIVSVNGTLYVTHGYYYDDETSRAVWKADTWAMDLGTKAWRLIHNGSRREAALTAYRDHQIPDAPCGRYGFSLVHHGDSLWMYGGDDGGYHRHGYETYEPGWFFDELWQLHLPTTTWTHHAIGKGPGPRYLHSAAVVAGRMFVFGGLNSDGDVWTLNMADLSWSHAPMAGDCMTHTPGQRYAHKLAATHSAGQHMLVLFGGLARCANDEQYQLSSQLWVFHVHRSSWQLIQQQQGPHPHPQPRAYTTLALLDANPDDDMTGQDQSTQWSISVMHSLPFSVVRKAMQKVISHKWLHRLWYAVPWCRPLYDILQKVAAPQQMSDMSDFAATSSDVVMSVIGVVAGGTLTSPGTTCSDEVWRFTINMKEWTVEWQQLESLPVPVYEHASAEHLGVVLVHGGHLCSKAYHGFPFFYTNALVGLQSGQHVWDVHDQNSL